MKRRFYPAETTFLVWVIGFLMFTIGGAMFPVRAQERTILFSNLQWMVRRSQGKQGPGPNFFKDWEDSVSLDETSNGAVGSPGKDTSTVIGDPLPEQPLGSRELHLRAVKHPNRNQWFSSEILTQEPLGYGTFQISLRIAEPGLDSNLIFGFFTYDQDPAQYHSEIDIELGFFGDKSSSWIHTSIQPSHVPMNTHAIAPPRRWGTFLLEFVWKPGEVYFTILREPSDGIPPWKFEHSIVGSQIPVPDSPHLHINLWFFQGEAPEGDGNLELVIEDIDYTPLY